MYDVIIIGCGVVGAATAYQLAKYRLRTLVLEAQNDVANGTTKANSAIIHAGYDPEPGTQMARLNVQGNRMAGEICEKLGVPFARVGSLVLAFCEAERQTLETLFQRGQANGVPGLLSLKEIIKLKSLFQNKNCKMTEFPNVIGEKQLQQLDERIKPYLFCERWFPFAEYAGSLYLMLDYNPSEKGEIGQIICYVHDPDFIYYVAPNITEALKMTETVIENLI